MVGSFFATAGLAMVGIAMLILILLVFISKDKDWSLKSSVFFATDIATILVLVFEIFSAYTLVHIDKFPRLNVFACRGYVFFMVLWFFIATGYVISVFLRMKDKKKQNLLVVLYSFVSITISLLIAIFLNISFPKCNAHEACLIGGKFMSVMRILSLVSSSLHVGIFFINRKKIKNINVLPIIFLLITYIISVALISHFNVKLNILGITLVLTILVIFITVESQDTRLLNELEETKQESIKSGEAKTEFLVNMSHEIRTPLTTILGFSQSLLYKKDLTPEMLKEDLSKVKHANNTLVTLIGSILDISNIENNKEVENKDEYSLENVIFEIYSYIPSKIFKDNLVFNITVNPDIPKYYIGDAKKIFKSITYIILNAVEYTEYGSVNLSINANLKSPGLYELEFIVSNSGHAMLVENFDKDFDDYIELTNSKNQDIKLGLIIAKRLINLINGKIEFKNEKGHGTKYIITLNQTASKEEKMGNIFDNYQSSNNKAIINCYGKTALIIDDKQENLNLMTQYLQTYGFSVTTAQKGQDGIALVRNNNYDIIFVDKLMPDMDGVNTIKTMKSIIPKLPPLIMLNSSLNEKNDNFKELGFDDYLSKPIIFKSLNKLIIKYFKNNQ